MTQAPKLNSDDATRVSRLKTHAECILFAKNVENARPDLAIAARRHGIELRLKEQGLTNPLLRAIWGAVYAYEEVLFLKHNKRLTAGHTRKTIKRNGEVGAVAGIVLRRTSTEGFKRLQEAGLVDRTFEFVVLQHAEHFDPQVVACAREKLAPWLDAKGGIAPPNEAQSEVP